MLGSMKTYTIHCERTLTLSWTYVVKPKSCLPPIQFVLRQISWIVRIYTGLWSFNYFSPIYNVTFRLFLGCGGLSCMRHSLTEFKREEIHPGLLTDMTLLMKRDLPVLVPVPYRQNWKSNADEWLRCMSQMVKFFLTRNKYAPLRNTLNRRTTLHNDYQAFTFVIATRTCC